MRSALALVLVLAAATFADAGDVGGGVARPDLFVAVPLESDSGKVVFPFGGSHHTLPGVVAVNRPPFVCVSHATAFRDRSDFVTHLRTRHGLSDDEIRRGVIAGHGQIRYVGN
jgi:hypothetical protein